MILRILLVVCALVAVPAAAPAIASDDAATTATITLPVCSKALGSWLSPESKTEWKEAAEGIRFTDLRKGRNGQEAKGQVDLFLYLRALDGKGHVLADTQASVDTGAASSRTPLRIRRGHGELMPEVEAAIADMTAGGKRVVRLQRAAVQGKALYYTTVVEPAEGEDLYVEVTLLMVRPVR